MARLVKIRNPWDQEFYAGPWSDSASIWSNEELLTKASHELENDGEFFVSIEDWTQLFESITIAQDVQGWKRSNHEVLGDDLPVNRQQVFLNDSTKYNTYTFELESEDT